MPRVILEHWPCYACPRPRSTMDPTTGRAKTYHKRGYKDWLSNTRAILMASMAYQLHDPYCIPPPHQRLWLVLTLRFRKLAPGDWDNYAKSVCDAGQGIIWHNDRSIREAHVYVREHQPASNIEIVWGTIDPADKLALYSPDSVVAALRHASELTALLAAELTRQPLGNYRAKDLCGELRTVLDKPLRLEDYHEVSDTDHAI